MIVNHTRLPSALCLLRLGSYDGNPKISVVSCYKILGKIHVSTAR